MAKEDIKQTPESVDSPASPEVMEAMESSLKQTDEVKTTETVSTQIDEVTSTEETQSSQSKESTEPKGEEEVKTEELVKTDEAPKEEVESKENKKSEESEEDLKVKKENAFKTIQNKFKAEKDKNKNLAAENKGIVEKIAKIADIDPKDLQEQLNKLEIAESGMTEEKSKEFKEMQEKLQKIDEDKITAKFEEGVGKLVDQGIDTKDIVKFIKTTKEETGIDFVTNPNPSLMLKLFKADNIDKVVDTETQKRLKVEKDVVDVKSAVQDTKKTNTEDDEWIKAMVETAKKDSL